MTQTYRMPALERLIKSLKRPVLIGVCLSAAVLADAAGAGQPAGEEPPKPNSQASPAESRYVRQAGVMDTAPAAADRERLKSVKPAPTVPRDDLSLLNTLCVQGWEGQDSLKLVRSNNVLAGADAKAVEEVLGRQSPVLVEYGCLEAVSRRFRRGQRYCEAGIFRFAGPDGAYGAYTTLRRGASTVVVRGQGSSEDDDSITFFSGNALVLLHSAEEDDEAKGMLGRLADQIAAYLAGGQPAVPRLIASLPRLDRLAGSERLFMGLQSATRYCNTPFLDGLLLDQSKGAVCADYLYPGPRPERLKLFVAEYGKQEVAQNAFNSYASTMQSFCRKTLDKTEHQILCKMSDSYLMCGTNGTKVWIISGARRASAPGVLVEEIVSR
jgi:hypothetical protein